MLRSATDVLFWRREVDRPGVTKRTANEQTGAGHDLTRELNQTPTPSMATSPGYLPPARATKLGNSFTYPLGLSDEPRWFPGTKRTNQKRLT